MHLILECRVSPIKIELYELDAPVCNTQSTMIGEVIHQFPPLTVEGQGISIHVTSPMIHVLSVVPAPEKDAKAKLTFPYLPDI
jgi:hypothetical protein